MARRRHNENSFRRGYFSAEIKESVRKLREKGEHVLNAAKQALRIGVDVVVADAKTRVPVRTGTLRDSIKAIKLEDGAAYELTADATNANGIAYGQFVEFGIYAQPFLYPAIEAHIDEVKSGIQQAIDRAVAGR